MAYKIRPLGMGMLELPGEVIATLANAKDAEEFFRDFDTKSNGRVKCNMIDNDNEDGCIYAIMSSGMSYVAEPSEG